MGILAYIFHIFCFIFTFLVILTDGACQCNQMLHPGVFSGERMTFATEANHERETRSDNGGKQSFNMGAISFEPPYLDFGEQPVGMPCVHNVVVFNPSSEKNLQLQAFSGDNTHFHVSFSRSQALSPLSNTTFEVIFLARTFGNVENTLFIHTSSAAYPYQVRGYGIANPYRLRPYLGARVALDHIFTSVLYMYNPHESPMQVTEIYSSGGDLHLELPSGEDDASPEHWQIAPYETKGIIRMNFLGKVASNHTAFIRIRTNKFNTPNKFLILPVEVEVTTAPGIFPSVDMLDFGTLRKMDEPKSIVVSLLNTHNKPITLTEVIVEPPNRAIKVHIRTTVIKPLQKYISSFSVTFTAGHLKNLKQNYGKIIVLSTSKGNPRMELNFQANVLKGTLAYSVSKTRFFIGAPPYEPIVREMVITNTFTFPLVIYRIVVAPDVQEYVSIVNFSSPIVVGVQKTLRPFSIRFLASNSIEILTSSIRVYTNASIFTIPVQCFDGRLEFRFSESMLNLGTLAVKQRIRKMFQIVNTNPVEIKLKIHTSNSTLTNIDYLDFGPDDKSQFLEIPAEGIPLKPSNIVQFYLDVKVPSEDGDYSGNLTFYTSYETKTMLFSFKAASGHIDVDPVKIEFNNSFPGQIQKVPLFLTSTFLNPVNVSSTLLKPDKPFTFVPIMKSNAQLAPNNRQKIGDIVFNPRLVCSSDCYLGISHKEDSDKAWFSSLSLLDDTARFDTIILENFQTKWNSLLQTKKNSFIRSLHIDTETVKGIEVTMQGGLTWPSLTPDRPIRFPLTHIGNTSYKTLTLENPADVPVVVQVVPLSVYPNAQFVIDVLSDRFDVDLLTAKPSYHSCFSLPTAEVDKYLLDKPDSDVTSSVESTLGLRTSPDVISMIVAPRSKANVPVQFKPENEDQRTSVIFIRNNLTALDVVTVQGQGARGELMINGKRPSGDNVLLFELKQKHLEDCTKLGPGTGGNPHRSLTVKKTVLATNPGQLATHVTSFNIDGYECEGYGFKVLNCKALNLKPSASVKIDIAFTPDFSVSRVSRRLQIKTSLGNVFEFSLIATIPSELIPLCAAAAGRPRWEYHAYISTAAVMICLLIVTLVMAHFEARKLITASLASLPQGQILLNGAHMNGDLFDLRKISAPTQPSFISENLYPPRQDSNGPSRAARKEAVPVEKPKASSYPQPFRSSSRENSERLASNNNSITTETSEYDRHKVKTNDKDLGRKQKKATSQQTKRKDSDTEHPKTSFLAFPINTIDSTTMELTNSECPGNETLKPRRNSSSSDANSVCSDVTVATLPGKKDKTKIVRKKTAKVSPAIASVEEKKTKIVDKAKVKDNENTKDKEKTDSFEKSKKIKNKQEAKEDNAGKESKKHDVVSKSAKLLNNRTTNKTSRKTSLPTDLEQTQPKPKLDKSKSLPTGSVSKQQSSKSGQNVANKKNSNKTQQNGDTPHTITEAINSALEITLKHSPTTETSQNFSRSHSRCSSTSPSPPLSDSSQNLSQSSRSSSYSSVVGSEESANSEPSVRKKKHHSKKPSPLVIQKPTEHTSPFTVKRLANSNLVNDLSGSAWKGLWDTTAPANLRGSPSLESFPTSATSSSLFTSTPFDQDGKLAKHKSGKDAPADDDPSGDKYPLYTFHDVKAPGLSTPFVEVGTSVPKFWPDEPIPSLENLIPMKQTRDTIWVNFFDESSTNASKLPSPGMPQSSKTVAEIWDAGHLADENDGWSNAFSPTLESDQAFPPFPGAYDSAWSTGTCPHDYYGMPGEETWAEADPSSTEAGVTYGSHDDTVYSSGTSHQLNPYSEPWDGSSRAKQNVWSSSSAF